MAKRINILSGLFALVAIVAGIVIIVLPNAIIEDVFISDDLDNYIYTIKLSLPFEYIDHIPAQKTEIIQVALKSNLWFEIKKNEYLGSETISPDILQTQLLTDIAYESLVVGGSSYLSFRFKEPVDYRLTVDEDLQNIVLRVKK